MSESDSPTLPSPPPSDSESQEEGRLGPFRVSGHLGAGGMGDVLRVADDELGRAVAAKVLRGPATPDQVARFLREARLTGQLEHPAIVPIYGLAHDDAGQPFFTMKEVRGRDLAALLAEQPPPLARRLGIFVRICEAIDYAHSCGVIHRDLKPANVMVGAHGEVLVMDWGLAKRLDEAPQPAAGGAGADPLATRDGTIAGTPAYMSPEQALGKVSELDARTDVYALGAILYHLLTGVPPFDGETAWSVIERVGQGQLLRPSARAEVPWELEAIVLRAMQREPAARYADAGALRGDVEAWLDGRSVAAVRYGLGAALAKWIGRHRALVGMLLAAVLGVVALLAWQVVDERAAKRRSVESAWENVRAAQAAGWVSAAAEATRDMADDPVRRPLPTPAARDRLSRLMRKLQVADLRLSVLAQLAPGDARARRLRHRVLLALGRAAEAAHEDTLARMAYASAARLGVDGARAMALAHRAAGAHRARLARREARIREHLAEAGRGGLTGDAYLAAVAELSSYRDAQTAALLVEALEAVSVELRAAARDALLRTATPDDAERAAGGKPIDRLGPVLDRWLARLAPGAPTPPRDPPALARAKRRLADRAMRAIAAAGRPASVSLERLLAAEQQARLSRTSDRLGVARLACDVLGLLGDPDGTLLPLARYVYADWDEARCAAAGVALARLARRSPEAQRLLDELLGLGGRPGRWPLDGVFHRRCAPALPTHVGELEHPALVRTRALMLSDRDPQAALALLDRALARHPRSAMLLAARGVAHHRAGQPKQALQDYDRALAIDGRQALARANRAALRAAADDVKGAYEDLSQALRDDPELVGGYVIRASLNRSQRRLDAAKRDIDRAIALAPASIRALVELGKICEMRRDFAGAEVAYGRALSVDPLNPMALAQRGMLRIRQGRNAEARACFDAILRRHPNDAFALAGRGEARRRSGQLAAAIADLRRAVEIDARLPRGWVYLGLALMGAGRGDEADRALTRAIELEPIRAQAHASRGALRVSRGDMKRGLADLEHAVELDPEDSASLSNLGGAYHRAGRLADARRVLDRALTLAPDDAQALRNRAMVRIGMRDPKGARADADQALRLAPDDMTSRATRALIALLAGDPETAAADVRIVLRSASRNATALYVRAELRRKRGDSKGALEDYDRALAVTPSNADLLFARANLRAVIGHPGALADADRCVQLAPRNLRARLLRVSLRRMKGDIEGAMSDVQFVVRNAPRNPEAYFLRGLLHHVSKRIDAAMSDYDRAIALKDDHHRARNNRAYLNLSRGKLSQARADLDLILRRAPRMIGARLLRAECRRRQGDLSAAQADVDLVLRSVPEHWEAHLEQAWIHHAAGRAKAASTSLASAEKHAPASARAQIQAARRAMK